MHKPAVRTLVACFAAILPWALKRPLLQGLLGYRLHKDSRIGFSVIVAAHVRMDAGARIGHLNVCRGLGELELGEKSTIGNLNWISGGTRTRLPRQDGNGHATPSLMLGLHSAITNRHYIDCSDRVEIGGYTIVAGVRSQLLTHSIDLRSSRQMTSPIRIGDYCFVGTGCIILSGAALPDHSVLGAGSLLRGRMVEPWTLYAGTPAAAIKAIPSDFAYFNRSVGHVD